MRQARAVTIAGNNGNCDRGTGTPRHDTSALAPQIALADELRSFDDQAWLVVRLCCWRCSAGLASRALTIHLRRRTHRARLSRMHRRQARQSRSPARAPLLPRPPHRRHRRGPRSSQVASPTFAARLWRTCGSTYFPVEAALPTKTNREGRTRWRSAVPEPMAS